MKPRNFSVTKAIIILFILSMIFNACVQDKYYRTETGLLYKIVNPPGKDSMATMGTTVKLNYIQKAGDTILESTYDKLPFYWMVMPGYGNRYNPLEVFNYGLREGDSVIIIQRVDSMIKKHIFEKLPPYLKMDDKWITYMKVEKVFLTDSLAQVDRMAEEKRVGSAQRIAGDLRVNNYLKEHNITTVKSDSGAYIQLIQKGDGLIIDTGHTAMLKYSFTNLHGKVVDSNTDTTFHHPDTLSYKFGKTFAVKSLDNSLKLLRSGDHAKIYLPTMLAFGPHPPKGALKPYDDVVFEVWVLKVL